MTRPLLICTRCSRWTEATAMIWRCPVCQGPLVWQGGERFDRSMVDNDRSGVWRYWRALPVPPTDAVTLNEPVTPLVSARIAGQTVLAKLDGALPTGSFKDRGATVLVSFLRAEGIGQIVEDSSGNAAAAMAGYAARAGIGCEVYTPATASPGKLVQAKAFGARVVRVEGNRDDVAHAAEQAATRSGNAYATHNWHPFFVEGVKTWAYEIWEQLGFAVPDAVIVPVGSGSALLGAWRAFASLYAGGAVDRIPRLYAAQTAACAPLVTAIAEERDEPEPFARTPSLAEGIMIANPVRGRELLTAIRGSGGSAVAVSEEGLRRALLDLAHQGLFVEPTSAVAVAACHHLLETGLVSGGEQIVILLTGNGLKATAAIADVLAS